MSKDPIKAWQNAKPFGDGRIAYIERDGARALPVERSPDFRAIFSNDAFVTVRPSADGPQVELSFGRNTVRRSVEFRRSEAELPCLGDNPREGEALMEEVIVEEVAIVLGPTMAAAVIKVLLGQLRAHASGTLEAAGLQLQDPGDSSATKA